MRTPPFPHWTATTTSEKVFVPGPSGNAAVVADEVQVPAWQDKESGEVYLDDRAIRKLEAIKARHMGR